MKYFFAILFLILPVSVIASTAASFPYDAQSFSFNLGPGDNFDTDAYFYSSGCLTDLGSAGRPCDNGIESLHHTKTILYVKAKRETPINTDIPLDDSYVLVSCADDAGYHNYIEIDRESSSESEWWGSDATCSGSLFLQNTDPINQARVWITFVPRVLNASSTDAVETNTQYMVVIGIICATILAVDLIRRLLARK